MGKGWEMEKGGKWEMVEEDGRGMDFENQKLKDIKENGTTGRCV